MASRSLQKLTNQATYYAKEASGFVGWGVPAALAAGWMVWPGLTPAFKEETLGIKATPAPGSAAAAASSVFSASGKYKFVRNEIGERPTLAGADDDDEDDE
ncbi:hypothetical protein P43SY_001439 [Pythium insidiosum]|uniref:Uncharacterized protein n=1 Tax=Pythium insidiosum TaxID=114742 RepID=A0AAD5LMG2_PYTIN|nr:hypothetical protein P43SY_001439 [Pythium insidiosum]KAJ0410586.1 hypothetical protein ATCC90586_007419 [Pythium insidiosum]